MRPPCRSPPKRSVSTFTGRTCGPGLKPFLVRAVQLNPGTGRFFVRFDGHDLYVVHASLGRRPVPMRRQPLVVGLPVEPANVYVTCGMDE